MKIIELKSYGVLDYSPNELLQRKQKQNLFNQMANYFNDNYFEEIGTKCFLSFFEQIQISLRIIFYIDGEEVSKENKGNNELDCIFINKSDKKVIPKNKFVTFKEVKQKTNEFHDEGNFSEIVVEKDVLMFMKVKTCWVALNKDNDNCDNVLKKLIKRSKHFTNYFKRLLLVKEDVNILLLFIYNNSMIFNIKKEFGKIKDIYSSLDMKNTTLK